MCNIGSFFGNSDGMFTMEKKTLESLIIKEWFFLAVLNFKIFLRDKKRVE